MKGYPSNAVVYLGEHNWEDGMSLATDLGLEVPNFDLMTDLLCNHDVKQLLNSMTSTTYRFNTSKYVYPDDNIKSIEDRSHLAKNRKAKVFGVGKDVKNLQPYQLEFFDYTKQQERKIKKPFKKLKKILLNLVVVLMNILKKLGVLQTNNPN